MFFICPPGPPRSSLAFSTQLSLLHTKAAKTNCVACPPHTWHFSFSISIASPSIRQKVLNLSGGNQQKVVIAKWLLVNPRILIVDEPTRGVDVGAKLEIYAILRELRESGTSIIVISSDLPEVLSISDRIYSVFNGTISGEVSGAEATEEMLLMSASGLSKEGT